MPKKKKKAKKEGLKVKKASFEDFMVRCAENILNMQVVTRYVHLTEHEHALFRKNQYKKLFVGLYKKYMK